MTWGDFRNKLIFLCLIVGGYFAFSVITFDIPVATGRLIVDAPYRYPNGRMSMKAIPITLPWLIIHVALAVGGLAWGVILWRKALKDNPH
ncbi:MAG: hypothetical protein H0W86_02385 [Armatimonadetes bacterium]|nr:hypothetical protein [Armatimonadota bacterium]